MSDKQGDSSCIGDKEYTLSRHGFGKLVDFQLVGKTGDRLTFALIAPTVFTMLGSQALSTLSWKMTLMPGTISHHTTSEPRQV